MFVAMSELLGIACLATCALTVSVIMLSSKLAEQYHVPFHLFMGIANLLMSCSFAAFAIQRGHPPKVKDSNWKWVLLRGTFAAGTFSGTMLAVSLGASLGDVSALGSISVVVAAFLGRVVLGEPLGALHLASLACAVPGALLVSKPDIFLGEPGTSSLIGVLCAVVAGASAGGACIAARKGQDVAPSLLCASVALQEGVALVLFSLAGVFKESLAGAHDFGWELLALVFLWSLLLVTLASFTMTVGAQLCTAATSSTVLTSTSMAASYTFQSFIFKQPPNAVSICGAALLLVSVILMTLARRRPLMEPAADPEGMGLVDFMAREFSGALSRSATMAQSVRQRHPPRPQFSSVIPAGVLGVASA